MKEVNLDCLIDPGDDEGEQSGVHGAAERVPRCSGLHGAQV